VRGSLPENLEVRTPPGLAYHQSSYMYNTQPQEREIYDTTFEYVNGDSHYRSPSMYDPRPKEPKETPLYDAFSEYVDGISHNHSNYPYDAQPRAPQEAFLHDTASGHMDGDSYYMATTNTPTEFEPSTTPSQTPSYTVQTPRSGSHLTNRGSLFASRPAQHVPRHAPSHHVQRSSPLLAVRSSNPLFPMDENDAAPEISFQPSQTPPKVGPRSASKTLHQSQLEPTCQPGSSPPLTVHNFDRPFPTDMSDIGSGLSSQPSQAVPAVDPESASGALLLTLLKLTRRLGLSPVPNPDPSTDKSGTASGISSRPSQTPPNVEPKSASRTPHRSQLRPIHQPGLSLLLIVHGFDRLSDPAKSGTASEKSFQPSEPLPEVEPESTCRIPHQSPLKQTCQLGSFLPVPNPDPISPTDESGTASGISSWPSQPPPVVEPESASRAPSLDPAVSSPPPTVNNPDPLSPTDEGVAVTGIPSRHIQPPSEVGTDPMFRTLHLSQTCRPVIMAQNPPERLHPTLSSWLKNMNKLSDPIDRLEELARTAPSDYRPQLYKQLATLRTTFKSQRERCIQFLRLTEEYADRYLLDISGEIQQQSSFLDILERRLDMAKTLYSQAIDLRKSYEAGTVNVMKNARKTGKAAFLYLLREIWC